VTQSSHPYQVSVWQDDYRSPILRRPWELLASSRQSSAAIYQSPRYFDYLQDSERDSRFEVVTIRNPRTESIVGVVPIKLWTFKLQFTFRASTLFEIGFRTLGILGSEPMIPEDPRAFDRLFLAMARRFPASQVIYIHALPSASFLWHHLRTSKAIERFFHTFVLDGFRESHSVPLPRSMDEYRKTLTGKKLYNLKRQEKLLRTHCGHPHRLLVIKEEADLRCLFEAITQLPMSKKLNFEFREEDFVHLCRYNFLHSYVLKYGESVVALLLGIRDGTTLKINGIAHEPSLARYSPGTTLWQLVLENLIESGEIRSVDFGYGVPAHPHRSTNVIEKKARVLLFRKSIASRCVILMYSCYSAALNAVRHKLGRRVGLVAPD
jgi:hypothetical protein